MSNLTDRLANLTPQQKALVLEKLQRHRPEPPRAVSIPQTDRHHPRPLSFSQQRLWFLSQFQPVISAYNITTTLCLEGNLNLDRFIQSLETIVQRHEVLRTHFGQYQGEPIQIIADQIPLPLVQLDWRSPASKPLEAELRQYCQDEAEQIFDLATGPLFRLVLIRASATVHYLIATQHHIITDAWSVGRFVQELITLYANPTDTSALPTLPIQYADYAQWQRQWINSAEAQQSLQYWTENLAGLPPLLELPTDHPRPPVQSFQGRTLSLVINRDHTQSIKDLAHQTGSTVFMVLEAAFALLLSRMSGQHDIAIGIPVANRPQAELEPLLGFFINTLVLRNDTRGNPTVSELIERTKQLALEGYRHQSIPFEYLVDALQPPRSLSHNPLFQVLFSLQNTPPPVLKIPGIQASLIPSTHETAKFDLSLLMQEHEETLVAAWEYNCDLFEEATIRRYQGYFETLLAAMGENPEAPILSLPILPASEYQQVIYHWNQTETPFQASFLLHGGFETQALRTPTAIALIYEQEQITYDELNLRANQFAHRLQALGVTSESLVGICVERSPEMVIGVLAILKAGGVYVPLDPSYPAERLADILEDAQPRVLLTQQSRQHQWGNYAGPVLCLDQPQEAAGMSEDNLSLALSPDQLAYVIYTSGSTGKPKGVMISHRGAVNTNLDINQRFAMGVRDRVIGLASLSFDLSVYDIFGILAVGAALVIPHHRDVLNPDAWLKLMNRHQVTFWNTAPAVMEMLMTLVQAQTLKLPATLRVVMMSGDAISVTLPNLIRQYASPEIQIYSFGGATEGSIWSICYPIDQVDPQWTSIPYGSPLSNQRFHILDEHLNPVPIGITGELHIGGEGVALGYWNRPELTAQRFIPDPFFPGDRLYKTGDLGRYRPDGTILFGGRIDHQVKIRGFRIELGEIEAAVTQYPGVKEAAILVREDQPGLKQLCAYLVPQPNRLVEIPGVMKSLRSKLPDYMVPSHILLLEEIPLTPNGKVNRKALPMPQDQAIAHNPQVLPKSQLERQIAEVWAQLLHVSPIGLHDNFFDLGGHSLLMVQVQMSLQATLEKDLNIVDLFQYPTIATLAEAIQAQGGVKPVQIQAIRPNTNGERSSIASQRRQLRRQIRGGEDDD